MVTDDIGASKGLSLMNRSQASTIMSHSYDKESLKSKLGEAFFRSLCGDQPTFPASMNNQTLYWFASTWRSRLFRLEHPSEEFRALIFAILHCLPLQNLSQNWADNFNKFTSYLVENSDIEKQLYDEILERRTFLPLFIMLGKCRSPSLEWSLP